MRKRSFTILILISFLSLIYFNPTVYNKQTEFFKRVININKTENESIEKSNFFNRFQNIKYFAHYDVALKKFLENIHFLELLTKILGTNAIIKNILMKKLECQL